MPQQLEQVVQGPRIATTSADIVAAYDANERDLFSFALATTRDRAVAEDVVQEAFLRLVSEAKAGRLPNDPRAWLYRVTVNLVRTRARRAIVAERWRRFFATRETVRSPEDEALRSERGEALRRALSKLSTEARMGFLLASEGMSGQEVAAILGRTEGATRTLLWRARLTLRAQLEAELQ